MSPTIRMAATSVLPSSAERASQIAPIMESIRIGRALRISIGESVSRSTTAIAGVRIAALSRIAEPERERVAPRDAGEEQRGQHDDRDRRAVQHQLTGASEQLDRGEGVQTAGRGRVAAAR